MGLVIWYLILEVHRGDYNIKGLLKRHPIIMLVFFQVIKDLIERRLSIKDLIKGTYYDSKIEILLLYAIKYGKVEKNTFATCIYMDTSSYTCRVAFNELYLYNGMYIETKTRQFYHGSRASYKTTYKLLKIMKNAPSL